MATTPGEVREWQLAALTADLIGPCAPPAPGEPDTVAEVLPLPPSRWYLTGFLAPQSGRERHDPTDDDELGAGSDQEEEETAGQEPEPKQRSLLPASMGMSVLLPAAGGGRDDVIRATVSWADYRREERTTPGRDKPDTVWVRAPRPPVTVTLPLTPRAVARGVAVPDSGGVRVVGRLAAADAPGLARGTRALSLFVVNRRSPGDKKARDERFLFQVRLQLHCPPGFVARPNRRDETSDVWDERVADLQFRSHAEYAVGHGVSTTTTTAAGGVPSAPVDTLYTTWIPRAEVRRVKTRDEPGVVTAMEELAELTDGAAARRALQPLVDAYGAWIDAQRRIDPGSELRAETRDQLLHHAEHAGERIEAGIQLLENYPVVLDAFRLMNRAMAVSARQRYPDRYAAGGVPKWRLFQLAFVVLNLVGLVDEEHSDRETVELIFFPTGGGKTEAYLGVVAFTLLFRRLNGQERPDLGLGVAVILRYTLRLLTLDQLGRAATLMCALEKLRQDDPAKLGDVRFAVGLWVGRSATANTLKEVQKRITEYKNSASRGAPSPFPLTHCPWCLGELGRDSLVLAPDRARPTEVVVGCTDFRCDFSARRNREGLPVLFVDEQIYRELPAFLVATVDKFAMMPWRGETGMLFGRVDARLGGKFYGPMDRAPTGAEKQPYGLWPPELIVQDELHLISGPLGTMVGLYETAIEALCSRKGGAGGDARVVPKVVASTATVRRARDQVASLFGRAQMALFPPPGVDDAETFFATVDTASPGRLYAGVAAPGRSLKAILLRTYVSLLASAARRYDPKAGAAQEADGYMTLAGYFNSLRELGGMRRLVEDEVRGRTAQAEERRPTGLAAHPWYANRRIRNEPLELTSREPTARIAASKARLELPYREKEHADVLLASNMLSVGVDIDRLGLMVMAGQPKTSSEYIQASSRVGRDRRWPGLVVTCFNTHRPRDRSQYERFTAYHRSFYRFVEATSLTPFSGPALDRGLVGTLVAMVRLAMPVMTPPAAVMELGHNRQLGERAAAFLAERAGRQPAVAGAAYDKVTGSLAQRGHNLLDAWERVTREMTSGGNLRCYSRFDRDRVGKPLLFTRLDEDRPDDGTDEARFAAGTSMRDVEPTVHLWVARRRLGSKRADT